MEVLRRNYDYLVRYHAAEALLVLLGTAESDPVALAAGRSGQAARLDVLEQRLQERLDTGAA